MLASQQFTMMSGTAASREQSAWTMVQAWMEAEHVPAVAFAVLRRGEVLCQGLSGWADREATAPVRSDTPFAIASVTKALTAMAVLLARDRGLIDLGAGIGSYLPGLPNPTWRPVTVRQLLSMSGGIPCVDGGPPADPRLLALLRRVARPDSPIPWNRGELPWYELLTLLAGYDVRDPGEPHPFLYSNVAYLLLGWLLQAVSPERDYALFLLQNVLWPLGMRATRMKTVPLPHGSAIPYEFNPATGSFQRAPVRLPSRSWSAGGLVSSLVDFIALERALCQRELLSPLSYREMWTPAVRGARRGDYGFGWDVLGVPGGGRVLAIGALPGVSVGMLRVLGEDLTAMLFANGGSGTLDAALGGLVDRFG